MIEPVRVVEYGRAATRALAEGIATAKGSDPLAPVTVVVPANSTGLSVRRVLASGDVAVPGGPRGLVNVGFVTPYRLAELLGRRRVAEAGLAPLTTPILAAAIREELRVDPGVFGPVAGHAATESALADLYAELSRARPETRSRLEAEGARRTRAVLAICSRVRERLAGFADEDALAHAAREAVAAGDLDGTALGTVIVFLPQPCTPALTALVRVVAEQLPVLGLVGLTGVEDADASVRALCKRLGWDLPAASIVPPHGTRIVSVSDADEEVRAVVRLVMTEAERGTRLDRIGILFPSPEPYARAVHEQLGAADIPHNGPPVQRLAASVAGRTLLRVLALTDGELRRDHVAALLTASPVRDAGGERIPGARWELISRRAGVIAGITDWDTKLAAFAAAQGERVAQLELDGASEGAIAGARREGEQAEALRAFVIGLAGELARASTLAGWADRATWARRVLDGLLGEASRRARWPEAELAAFDRVEDALERLAVLDAIEPRPSEDVFERAVAEELDAPMGRIGRFGEGVVCGSLGLGLGLDLDVVFVLGLAEDLCPARRRDDSLVPDADRGLAVDGELSLRAGRVHEQHRDFLAALASGTRERVLVFPRGDHRTGRGRTASRWLLDTASVWRGSRVYAGDVDALDAAILSPVASFAAGVREAGVVASLADRDLAGLLRHSEAGLAVRGHHLAAETGLAAGLELQEARAAYGFSRWDGNLAGRPVPSPATGAVLSPTRLETWARCPFRYFLGSVLGLGVVDAPEGVVEISPLERGSLVHEVLERFLRPVVAAPPDRRIAASEPWPPEERERLLAIGEQMCAEYEARGVTGKPLLWRIAKESLLADLEGFLEADDRYRAETGAVPERVEMAFGLGGEPPVRIPLPDGRALAFRGQADRVDRTPDGALTVLDYKTGKGKGYAGIDTGDPVAGGTRLQLPLYAEAACQQLGAPTAHAAYWFASQDGGFRRVGYDLDDDRAARFRAVLGEIVHGIEHGVFPAVPGETSWWSGTFAQCAYCEFDDVCPAERAAYAEAKADAPELARYYALADDGNEEEEDE